MVNEADIQKALDDLESQEVPNYSATASKFKIDRKTLQRRHKGISKPRELAYSESHMLLTIEQEKVLLQHVNALSDRGLPPTPQFLRNLVFEIVKKQPGKNWVATFCKRHQNEIKSLYLRAIDQKRQVADNSAYFQHFYTTLQEKIEKYHIKPQNIHNFDEKGFMLGVCHSYKRIVGIKQLKSKKIIGASQDGSREFISLLACICADGTAIPPALIYQGTSGDLQDTWLEDFDHSSDQAYFATSEKGWTDENLGMKWLQSIFDRHTKEKAGNSRRLLIVDGHSSHVNLRFVNYCDRNGILLVVLPPHSTHRLQPLDVGIFPPLANAYSQVIDRLIQSSCGFSHLTKRSFWRLFSAAWKRSVTFSNIKSAFSSPGICPLEPRKVLGSLEKKTPSPASSENELERKTPSSVRGIRRLVKEIQKTQPTYTAEMEEIIRACGKLAIQNEILRHENTGLREALVGEKKKGKRGKGMGLFDKEWPGEAQFFFSSKGCSEERRIQQAQKREQKARERQEKAREREEKKQAKIIERQQLAKEREERKGEKLVSQQIAQEIKAQSAAERVAKRKRSGEDLRKQAAKRRNTTTQNQVEAPKKAIQKQKEVSKKQPMVTNLSIEACGSSRSGSKQDERDLRVSRTGRKITLPQSFPD